MRPTLILLGLSLLGAAVLEWCMLHTRAGSASAFAFKPSQQAQNILIALCLPMLSLTIAFAGRGRRHVPAVAIVIGSLGLLGVTTLAGFGVASLRPLFDPRAYDQCAQNASARLADAAGVSDSQAQRTLSNMARLAESDPAAIDPAEFRRALETRSAEVRARIEQMNDWPRATREEFAAHGVGTLRMNTFVRQSWFALDIPASIRLEAELLDGFEQRLAELGAK